ncbi:MAG: hypothetical protein WAN22_03670, partial [Solirubrobacteraceae bacterium]
AIGPEGKRRAEAPPGASTASRCAHNTIGRGVSDEIQDDFPTYDNQKLDRPPNRSSVLRTQPKTPMVDATADITYGPSSASHGPDGG